MKGIFINGRRIDSIFLNGRKISFVYRKGRLIWNLEDLIKSCYSNGYWLDEYSWIDDLSWKD